MASKFKNEIFEVSYDSMSLQHIIVVKIADMLRGSNEKEEVIKSIVSEFGYILRKIILNKEL